MAKAQPEDRPFVFRIERTFHAPRERVWRAWTDVEQLKRWFGPKGCSVPYCSVDLRPGGAARYRIEYMGSTMWGKWAYQDITAPERLVAIVSFTDETGAKIIEHPHSPGWPLEILSTITFTETDGKTKVTIEWVAHNATDTQCRTFKDGAPSMQQGWGGSLDQLAAFLAEGR